MIQIGFSTQEQDILYEGYTNHTHSKVRMKMQVLYLKSIGLSPGKIINICRISRATLSSSSKKDTYNICEYPSPKYYPIFEEFRNALKQFLNNLNNLKKHLSLLLTSNFQSFENVQILTC